eukprot:comp17541_c1_seq1/m.17107 comp17541_c1_seq1/g.17107  ORF comp17541_c1_seq1/g.17107 comp17541_c1_seq1/m.17107 type:complete len:250 (-) comp17541_c1_seq1:363-1112(-)
MAVDHREAYFSCRHKHLIFVGCASPVAGLLFCIIYSLMYNFDDVNNTHCKVANIVPSLSSCIGNHHPQVYVWRMAVAVMLGQRLVDSFAYHTYLNTGPVRRSTYHHSLNHLHLFLMLTENMALVLLTYVSSTENHPVHVAAFTTFITSSQLHMGLLAYLYKLSKGGMMIEEEHRSYRWKLQCLQVNVTVMALACYLYYRHNTYCEPYMYSLFSSCEWTVVFSNIWYHYSAVLDFADCNLSFGPSPMSRP